MYILHIEREREREREREMERVALSSSISLSGSVSSHQHCGPTVVVVFGVCYRGDTKLHNQGLNDLSPLTTTLRVRYLRLIT